jgi:hypothetical protein
MVPGIIDFTIPIILSIITFISLNYIVIYFGIIGICKIIYYSTRHNKISISSIIYILFMTFIIISSYIFEVKVFYYFTYKNILTTSICMFAVILHMIYLLGDNIYIRF